MERKSTEATRQPHKAGDRVRVLHGAAMRREGLIVEETISDGSKSIYPLGRRDRVFVILDGTFTVVTIDLGSLQNIG